MSFVTALSVKRGFFRLKVFALHSFSLHHTSSAKVFNSFNKERNTLDLLKSKTLFENYQFKHLLLQKKPYVGDGDIYQAWPNCGPSTFPQFFCWPNFSLKSPNFIIINIKMALIWTQKFFSVSQRYQIFQKNSKLWPLVKINFSIWPVGKKVWPPVAFMSGAIQIIRGTLGVGGTVQDSVTKRHKGEEWGCLSFV